jgi:inosine-uridine nucleoside N-ribohydrolase
MIMGGSFGINPLVERIESNVSCDPLSASVVYGTRVWPHQSVGLDVTRPTRSSASRVRSTIGEACPALLTRLVEEWLARHDTVTFNDPLAAASLFEPGLCRFERGCVRIEVHGPLAGLTRWSASASGPHEIAAGADTNGFIAHFAAVVQGSARAGTG